MTSTTTTATPPKKRIPVVLITNVCVALFLLTALPIIHHGQQGFVPYAAVNREYVNTVISSGQADFMNRALKTTETARAMAHESHVSTMGLMQMAVATLAVLFILNSFFIFRLHRQPQPAPIPHVPAES